MPLLPLAGLLMAALSFGLGACAPRYAHLPAMEPRDLQAPLPVQHSLVDGIDVAWIDSGPGADWAAPPIVLVHGLSSWMGFWEYQVPELAKDRRVLALDLPGYGASGRPDAPCTPPWYAELLSRWLTTIQVERAVIVGHSMGGQIAMTLALEHPEQVDRLILSAPAGFEILPEGVNRWLKAYWTESRALDATEDQTRTTFHNFVFNKQDAGTERLLEERVRMRDTAAFRGTAVAVSRSVAGMIDHPVLDRLGEIKVPTLIVFGTDDHMIPNPFFTRGPTRAIAEKGARAIPDATLEMIPGAGHTVHHDAPEAFNAAVREFLKESR